MTRLGIYMRAIAVVAVAALATAAAATAAPIPDSQFVQSTFTTTPDNGFAWPVFFLDPAGSFLPSASCAFAPGPRGAAQLTANLRGWEGPLVQEPIDLQVVFFHADVHGTVSDTSGAVYRLNGSFAQSGLTRWSLGMVPFDGYGHLTVAGPTGVVTGDAAFRIVRDFPFEWDFSFTDIQQCSIR